MTPDDFQKELDARVAEKKVQDSSDAEVHAINKAGIKNVEATNTTTRAVIGGVKAIKAGVKVTNPDLAKTADLKEVTDAIHKSNLTAYMANKGLPELADNLSTLNQRTQELQDKVEDKGLVKVSQQLDQLLTRLEKLSKSTGTAQVTVDRKLQDLIGRLGRSIDSIDFNPSVNVSAPDTKVITTPVDFAPILRTLQAIQTAIEDKETPDNRPDLDPVISGLSSVQNAITSLRFPVPNYVLPFKDINGKDVQVQLDASGNLPTSGGSGGGGTQYTDGAAAVTHPIGTQQVFTNGSSIVTAVSTANPLPVSATFSGSVTSSPTFATTPGSSPTAAYGLIDASFRPVVVGPGTAGSPTGGVLSVQGVVSGTVIPVSGTFFQATQPVSLATNTPTLQSGSTTAVTQATAANLNATVVGTGTLAVQNTAATPAGTNVIGHVITDTGSTTVVTGTVAVTQSTSPWVTNDPGIPDTLGQKTMANSTGVVLASDQSSIPVAATLSAETTKVIGTVNQGTSPWVTSNATTSVVGNGTAAAAQRITLANDSTGAIATVGAVTSITNALPAGTNLLGKVGIDQTTPGTTNLVALTAETTKVIGTVNQGTSPWVVSGNLTNISGTISLPTGAATSANQSTGITSLATIAALSKAEDAPASSGDTGIQMLGVRNDTVADSTNTNGDYTQVSTDVKGHILTADAPRVLKGRQLTTITSSTAETTIVTAVASTFLDIYRLVVTNTSATACTVTIKDSTAGTTVWVWNIPAGDSRGMSGPIDAAANQSTVNNNWTATCGTSVASIVVTAEYVKNI